MKVELTTAAEIELDEAIAYYNSKSPELGTEFSEEARRAAQRIIEYPRARPLFGSDPEIRRCLFNRFPYGLVYAIEGDVAVVLAVMHLHRDPTYWRHRLVSLKR